MDQFDGQYSFHNPPLGRLELCQTSLKAHLALCHLFHSFTFFQECSSLINTCTTKTILESTSKELNLGLTPLQVYPQWRVVLLGQYPMSHKFTSIPGPTAKNSTGLKFKKPTFSISAKAIIQYWITLLSRDKILGFTCVRGIRKSTNSMQIPQSLSE